MSWYWVPRLSTIYVYICPWMCWGADSFPVEEKELRKVVLVTLWWQSVKCQSEGSQCNNLCTIIFHRSEILRSQMLYFTSAWQKVCLLLPRQTAADEMVLWKGSAWLFVTADPEGRWTHTCRYAEGRSVTQSSRCVSWGLWHKRAPGRSEQHVWDQNAQARLPVFGDHLPSQTAPN